MLTGVRRISGAIMSELASSQAAALSTATVTEASSATTNISTRLNGSLVRSFHSPRENAAFASNSPTSNSLSLSNLSLDAHRSYATQSNIKVFSDPNEMRNWSRQQRAKGLKIAFVPTMGYLHEGHVSLVKAARERADIVVASIYVNPTQFRKGEDFDAYPQDREGDRRKLAEAGCVAVFEPKTLYYAPPGASESSNVVGNGEWTPGAHETWVTVEHLQQGLCAITRPTFFRGVATVVSKLFHIVEPDIAVFGKKDYQQWRLICRMVRDLDFGIDVVGMPTRREPDGLAMSSRNVRLKGDERTRALAIFQGMSWAKEGVEGGRVGTTAEIQAEIGKRIAASGGKVDYIEVVDQENLKPVARVGDQPVLIVIAAFYGSVRLIDNMEVGVAGK